MFWSAVRCPPLNMSPLRTSVGSKSRAVFAKFLPDAVADGYTLNKESLLSVKTSVSHSKPTFWDSIAVGFSLYTFCTAGKCKTHAIARQPWWWERTASKEAPRSVESQSAMKITRTAFSTILPNIHNSSETIDHTKCECSLARCQDVRKCGIFGFEGNNSLATEPKYLDSDESACTHREVHFLSGRHLLKMLLYIRLCWKQKKKSFAH